MELSSDELLKYKIKYPIVKNHIEDHAQSIN